MHFTYVPRRALQRVPRLTHHHRPTPLVKWHRCMVTKDHGSHVYDLRHCGDNREEMSNVVLSPQP